MTEHLTDAAQPEDEEGRDPGLGESWYRKVVETSHDGVWAIDAEGRTTFANRTMERMLGCDEGEMIGKTMYDFMDEEERAVAERNLERRSSGVAEQHEFRLRRKDGTHVWTLMSANPLYNRDGEFAGAVAMTTDLTERKQIERQLREAHKLEAVGRLARGVAHDLSNLVTAIHSNAELLRLELPDNRGLHSYVGQIELAAERAADLTRHLMAFGRQQKLAPVPVCVPREVGRVEPLLRSILNQKGVRLTLSTSDSTWIKADPAHLSQVLLNLILNARDAVSRDGKVEVRVSSVELDGSPGLDAQPGRYVNLTVADDGVGMDEDTVNNAFEPFFTTKEHGTGLGLATVYGIVKQSGGSIQLESARGVGTRIDIYLPQIDPPAEDG